MTKSVDYFKLPFEVYYSEAVGVTMYEFKSDIACESFEDIKAVHLEQGRSWGLSFICNVNNGPELYCCIINGHDEVEPDWLTFLEEENVKFNYAADYAVEVDGSKITFVDDEVDDIDDMDYCCRDTFIGYSISDASPDFIVLDALDSRVRVNLEGYVLDDNNDPTDERIFNPAQLNHDDYEDFSTKEMWDAKFDWVQRILKDEFPQDIHLNLSFDTE